MAFFNALGRGWRLGGGCFTLINTGNLKHENTISSWLLPCICYPPWRNNMVYLRSNKLCILGVLPTSKNLFTRSPNLKVNKYTSSPIATITSPQWPQPVKWTICSPQTTPSSTRFDSTITYHYYHGNKKHYTHINHEMHPKTFGSLIQKPTN